MFHGGCIIRNRNCFSFSSTWHFWCGSCCSPDIFGVVRVAHLTFFVWFVLLTWHFWCGRCCSPDIFGIVRVAHLTFLVWFVLLTLHFWCGLCCSPDIFGVVRVAHLTILVWSVLLTFLFSFLCCFFYYVSFCHGIDRYGCPLGFT